MSAFTPIVRRALTASLRAAQRRHGLDALVRRLEEIVPDIHDQYSVFDVEGEYLETKVRGLHAFQVSLVETVITEFGEPAVADIGDSSGTHLRYLMGLHPGLTAMRCLSVNLDPAAVERIRRKGLEAICARAEDLAKQGVDADVLLCFETLEHLTDPVMFLRSLAESTPARYLVVTVPFARHSRVGLAHIRRSRSDDVTAENTHVFELCPEDWMLLAKHAGWGVERHEVYLQYPRVSPLAVTRLYWRTRDFEGFFGMVLIRDDTWSSKYVDWPGASVGGER